MSILRLKKFNKMTTMLNGIFIQKMFSERRLPSISDFTYHDYNIWSAFHLELQILYLRARWTL